MAVLEASVMMESGAFSRGWDSKVAVARASLIAEKASTVEVDHSILLLERDAFRSELSGWRILAHWGMNLW